MDVFAAIFGRRTLGRLDARPVERAKIERLLQAAVAAPNHHRTQPWRFAVVTGATTKERLAELRVQQVLSGPARPGIDLSERAERNRREIVQAPVLLLLSALDGKDPQQRLENYAATCCAAQNMLLAAHAEGLAVAWRTGRFVHLPQLGALLGLPGDAQAVGLFYIGYPAPGAAPARRERTPPAAFTVWHED